MIRNRHTLIACVLGASLAGLLAGCGTNASSTGASTGASSVTNLQISGNAQSWTGGEAVLRAVGTNQELDYFVSFGHIADNGDFSIELPKTPNVPDSFGPLKCEANDTGKIVLTPSTLRVTLIRSFGVSETQDSGSPVFGEVENVSGDPTGNGAATLGTYAYASSAGSVKGTCPSIYGNPMYTFDLSLEAGWNHVILSFTDPSKDFTATYRTAPLPENLSWVYNEFPTPPKEPPPPPPQQQ